MLFNVSYQLLKPSCCCCHNLYMVYTSARVALLWLTRNVSEYKHACTRYMPLKVFNSSPYY